MTGAAGTLGSAVASVFHAAGARVTGIDIVESDAAWNMTTADLIDPTTAAAAFADLGSIDVLANIAGGFTMGDAVADTSDATWDFMMNLNARTVLNAARAVVPGMKAAGHGKIVNISARGGLRGSAAMGAYAASKAVVQRLTETLADELKADGINVNCILPSIIDTPQKSPRHAQGTFRPLGAAGGHRRRGGVSGFGCRPLDSRRIHSGGGALLTGGAFSRGRRRRAGR